MRIGIDARPVQDHFPGIGRYTFNLIRALAEIDQENSYLILHDPRPTNSHYDLNCLAAPNFELRRLRVPLFSLREQILLPLTLRGASLDLFHSPYYIRPYLLPYPNVITIHDTIPLHSPRYLPSRRSRLLFRLTMALALRRSNLIIVDSQASKADLIRFYGLSPAKIRVVPLAADEFQAQAPQGHGRRLTAESDPSQQLRPYILYVGINKPHKNLDRLIRAYHRSGLPQRLVIAGPEDKRFPQPRQTVVRLGLEERVRFLGRVSDDALALLYCGAELFVFPSLAEGFGLPLLEAMACGVPTVAADIPPLAELAGDAALLVNPFNTQALAQALRRTLEDEGLRSRLRERGLARSRDFSWRKTAELTLAAYGEVAPA